MQLDVSYNAILQHVLYTAQVPGVSDVGLGCAGIDLANDLSSVTPTVTTKTLANGLQTLAGSVPIYKGNVLVGGLGVSGDGIDQDDFVAFMGLHNAGLTLGTVNQAPKAMRADQLTPQGVRLRYVQCPISPYTNSSQQSACAGK
jgi:hypothetical protein